ncbi:hypothetical protein K438DRAFT_1985401 [Mycena galopus ATCC 62051]|nr:hypothetical protein K438DRAFT_1985401 [Mycena galopus ATCC 62051]
MGLNLITMDYQSLLPESMHFTASAILSLVFLPIAWADPVEVICTGGPTYPGGYDESCPPLAPYFCDMISGTTFSADGKIESTGCWQGTPESAFYALNVETTATTLTGPENCTTALDFIAADCFENGWASFNGDSFSYGFWSVPSDTPCNFTV